MGLLERWDRRNQAVLEEHNRRPAPEGKDWLAGFAVFTVGNVVFQLGGLVVAGWTRLAAGGLLAFAVTIGTWLVVRGRPEAGSRRDP